MNRQKPEIPGYTLLPVKQTVRIVFTTSTGSDQSIALKAHRRAPARLTWAEVKMCPMSLLLACSPSVLLEPCTGFTPLVAICREMWTSGSAI